MLTLSRTIQFGFDVKNQPRTIRLSIMCVEVTRTISFFPNLSFRSSTLRLTTTEIARPQRAAAPLSHTGNPLAQPNAAGKHPRSRPLRSP